MVMKPKLSLEARRIKTIIITLPIMVACSCKYPRTTCVILPSFKYFFRQVVLYKRHYLGEERRQLPTALTTENRNVRLSDSEKERTGEQ